MPRILPRLDKVFSSHIRNSLDFIERVELSRVLVSRQSGKRLRISDIELSYELAYLRIFIAWEDFLEQTLIRLICGYAHSAGQEPLQPRCSYYRNILAAEAAILSGRRYKLWHDPIQVISRAQRFLLGSRFEIVISSAQSNLEKYSATRHRIAHSQKDARIQFDNASMSLSGRRYLGARPGRFLRDWQTNPIKPERWLETIAREFESLASQICH